MSGPPSDVRLSEKQRERIWKATYWHLRRERGWSQNDAMREATRLLEQAHGKSLKLEGTKPPLWARIGLWFVGRSLDGMEVKMSPLIQKAIVSLVFGVSASALIFQGALSDGVITGGEWLEILSAFVAAAWGKFSSNTTILAPSRKGETVAGPK